MRVDGPQGEMLAFDNMDSRPIQGTKDWEKVEIVLNVPEDSSKIAFGLLLRGSGQAWLDDIEFEAVSEDIDVTEPPILVAPVNLNFETALSGDRGSGSRPGQQ